MVVDRACVMRCCRNSQGHDATDDAVDALCTALLRWLVVSGGILLDGNVRRHPTHDGMPSVVELAREHEPLERGAGGGHRKEALAEAGYAEAVVRQLRAKLRTLEYAIDRDLLDPVQVAKVIDVSAHHRIVSHSAFGQRE